MSATRAVALDWNGTVVDDLERAVAATNAVLHGFGRSPLRVGEFRDAFTLPLTSFFSGLGLAGEDVDVAVLLWNQRLLDHPVRLSVGMAALAAACTRRGIELVVVSAADVEVIAADARALGVGSMFSTVVAPSTDKAVDLRDLRATFSRLIYVGDTDSDIDAAHRAGLLAIGYAGGYHHAERLVRAGADSVIEDLADTLTAWEACDRLPLPAPGALLPE